MNRRKFLSITSVGFGSMLLGACVKGQEQGIGTEPGAADPASSGKASSSIIVIGAGMSGLAAARKLRNAGKDVIVLEARSRMGGRIYTHPTWKDARVDLGATWIHGAESRNPIAQLAREAGARLATTRFDSQEIYATNGAKLDDKSAARIDELQRSINTTLKAAQSADRDQSIQDAVRGGLDYAKRSEKDKESINYLVNTTIEHEYGGDATRLSTYWYDSDVQYGGDDKLFLDGYQVLIDHLAQGLDVRLEHEVTAITYGEEAGVTVTTNQGDFNAQHVVITLPLGVLQSGAVRFTPQLSNTKQTAINKLGMGLLNKCYLRFPYIFWNDNVDWINYIPAVEQYGHWAEWVSFARPSGQPILLGFNAAAFGHEIESWSDNQIIDSAMATLKKMYGEDIPNPTDWSITRWGSDPYAKGAYSCNVLGSTPQMRIDLASNVNGRLFFAGEATEKQYFQTVHGAYLSGLRAADEVLAN